MIKVENLYKNYGDKNILNNINFNISEGDIIGFLGPNGAGKTTTIRIITNYINMTSGNVWINGINIKKEPIEIKKYIGYLPENIPLYNDMKVIEFLKYRAKLKDVPSKKIKNRIIECSEICNVEDVLYKMISNLSKGYKQRVGLADALLSDPKILILDEPTSGLDPNQRIQVRKLINNLSKSHTILLSSHILYEIENVCNKAIIINKGKIIANDTMDNFKNKIKKTNCDYNLILKSENDLIIEVLQNKNFIENIYLTNKNENLYEFDVKLTDNDKSVDDLYLTLKNNNVIIREFSKQKNSLEDIFVELIKN